MDQEQTRLAIIFMPKNKLTTFKALEKHLRRKLNVKAVIIEKEEGEIEWYIAKDLTNENINEVLNR